MTCLPSSAPTGAVAHDQQAHSVQTPPASFVPSFPRRTYNGGSPHLRRAIQEMEDRRIREEYEEAQRIEAVRRIATTSPAGATPKALAVQGIPATTARTGQLPPHTPSPITPTTPSSPTKRRTRKPRPSASTSTKLKRWRYLDRHKKLQAEIETAARHGGMAFSLNLGIGREGALLNSDDPARRLAHYLSRELRKGIGRDLLYTLALELVRDDNGYNRLHAHGAVIPGAADLDKIKQAFLRAGGAATGSLAGARQLVLKPFKKDPAGWFSYCMKTKRWGKAQPNGRSVYTTRPLSQLAQHDYGQFGLSRPVAVGGVRRKTTPRPAGKSLKADLINCFY